MENKVHRLERLLCYILLAFVGFVDLIHGSLSSNESRGTSSGSGNSEAGSGGGSTTNSTGSHHSRREGSNNSNNNNNNNSRNTRNNNHNNNSHNNKNNITMSLTNSEHVFRQALTGRHLLAGYNHQQRPTTSLHHHHLYHQHHNDDQQLQQYKNLTDKVFFVRLDSDKFNQTKTSQPKTANLSTLNIPNITRERMDSLFNQRALKINTSVEGDADALMHFQVKKQLVNDTTLVWLPSGNGSLPSSNGALPSVNGGLSNRSLKLRYRRHQQQHVDETINRRKAPLLTNAALKTDKKVHVTITREPYETVNITGIQINPKTYRKNRTKRDETYVVVNTTNNSKNRMPNWWDMMLSDEVVTARDGDDAPKSNGYKEFSPPNQLAFLKRPPTNDVSHLGNTLSYNCEVDTSNLTVDPEIYWTIPDRITKEEKGPEDLYPGEFRHDVFVDDNHTLIIKNVQMEHRGMYICVASVGQVTEMVTMVLRVTRVTRYDLSVRLIVGFSVAFVVIVVFGSAWMVLRVMKNREIRAEEENSPTETTEIRRTTTDIHYFL